MPRYVDLDKLVDALDKRYKTLGKQYGFGDMYVRGYGEAINDMEDEPEVDVQEVKRGRWELIGKNVSKCTACGCARDIRTQIGWNFCPTCGAKMLEE